MDEFTLQSAAAALRDAAPPGSQIILFGSQARGNARPNSDADFLVVEPKVRDRFGEMTRLSHLLGKMLVPADVVVMGKNIYDRFRDTPNTLAYTALREGRVL